MSIIICEDETDQRKLIIVSLTTKHWVTLVNMNLLTLRSWALTTPKLHCGHALTSEEYLLLGKYRLKLGCVLCLAFRNLINIIQLLPPSYFRVEYPRATERRFTSSDHYNLHKSKSLDIRFDRSSLLAADGDTCNRYFGWFEEKGKDEATIDARTRKRTRRTRAFLDLTCAKYNQHRSFPFDFHNKLYFQLPSHIIQSFGVIRALITSCRVRTRKQCYFLPYL